MDIVEAYKRTLEAAENLRAEGIRIEIEPSKSTNISPDNQLPRDKWVVITFHPKNKSEANLIKNKADELGWAGIVFDTSGHAGLRDWEIDWSFGVDEVPDGERQKAREDIEDLIDGSGGD